MGSGGKGGGQQRPDLLGKENGQQNGFGGVMPPGVMPPGGEQMMHFAAGSLAQNVSGRFQSAAPIVGGYWNSLKYYFEVRRLLRSFTRGDWVPVTPVPSVIFTRNLHALCR